MADDGGEVPPVPPNSPVPPEASPAPVSDPVEQEDGDEDGK
jgi:hypothetical protein